MAKTGELCETRGEIVIEWKLENFRSLSEEKNIRYESPTFHYSGTSWELWLYPNGETENKSEGWISVYLMRMSTGTPVTVTFTISLKTADGKSDSTAHSTLSFAQKKFGNGPRKLISRIELIGRQSELLPSDELTVICTLKSNEPTIITSSVFNRLKGVCDNLKEVYKKAKGTDFNLKFNGEKIATHKMILEASSPIFSDIIAKKGKTGEASITDTDKKTMDILLEYIYSGDMERMTKQSALPLYGAAIKYDINDVKIICEDFIKRNLSVEWVCDVIKFAEIHQEKDLSLLAREYFKENVREIVETENWAALSREKRDLSIALLKAAVKESVDNQHVNVDLLGSVVKSLLPSKVIYPKIT